MTDLPAVPPPGVPDPTAPEVDEPASPQPAEKRNGWWETRIGVLIRAAATGVALAGSVPPWGWWPLAFVGMALLDRLIAGQPRVNRFRRTWLVAAFWLYPAMLWMWDLTAPGYVAAGAFYAAYFGLAGALTPSGPTRRLVLPGAFALAEIARWSWPFGGVPPAHMGLSQVETPLIFAARLAGPPPMQATFLPVSGPASRSFRPCSSA